ncbi:MAG: LPS assembly lipoprotein LptE [Luteolibacter sp.]
MKSALFRILAAIAVPACLVSCAGYELGGRKPQSLAGIERIAVPMFSNATQHPRAEALATSAVASAITKDGTYRIASGDRADAVLEGTLRTIDYSTVRGTRFDTLLAEEFRNTVTIQWQLRDARDPTRILARGTSQGSSQLFRDSNLQTARNNALNDALESAAESLVSRIADSF